MIKRLLVSAVILVLASCSSQPAAEKPPEVAPAAHEPVPDMYAQQKQWPGACQHATAPDQRQSPIALSDALFSSKRSSSISFHYKPALGEIIDNGHTLQYRFKGDPGYIVFEGKKYQLKQFHFHKSSEHSLNGKLYDMEVHFVHMKEPLGKDEKPTAVALGFLVSKGAGQAEWSKLWAPVPVASKDAAKVDADPHHENILATGLNVNIRSLIPAKGIYYAYEGSLTTPGCDEMVTHVLAKTPLSFTETEIQKFTAYHAVSNRDLQPLGDSKVRKYRLVNAM